MEDELASRLRIIKFVVQNGENLVYKDEIEKRIALSNLFLEEQHKMKADFLLRGTMLTLTPKDYELASVSELYPVHVYNVEHDVKLQELFDRMHARWWQGRIERDLLYGKGIVL